MILKSRFLNTVGLLGLLALALPTALLANKAPLGPALTDPPSICDAIAGNLVTNCGFETGNTTSWTFTPAAAGSDFFIGSTPTYGVNSGHFDANFGATASLPDTLSQTLPTTAGNFYTVSFFLANDTGCGASNCSFTASWDGVTEVIAPTTAFGFTRFGFTALGIGSDTLTFAGDQAPAWYGLDDVSALPGSPTPEPSSILLFGSGLLGLGGILRRRLLA
jgi:hypothetical protein